jgi:hypothetical protein
MTRLVIPEHATVAHLQGLLMRWPCSARLKYEINKAKMREAREADRAARKLRGRIRKALKTVGLSTLQQLAADLEDAS